jgi:hypothetical protein
VKKARRFSACHIHQKSDIEADDDQADDPEHTGSIGPVGIAPQDLYRWGQEMLVKGMYYTVRIKFACHKGMLGYTVPHPRWL